MKKKFPYRYIISVVFSVVLVSCSVEKNTLINRSYHNLTAHYNVYFNGNEAMKAGLQKIEKQVEEDYTKILPVFKESLPNTEQIVASDMTTAIEKGTKLIKFHSITNPPKTKNNSRNRRRAPVKSEYNNWVDNAYMMMGRAYLYKKEYIMAISTFQLILRKFKDEPVKYDANLWLIRSMSESERYTEAAQIIQMLENDKSFPKKLEGELAILNADLQMKQQHYDEAIHQLNIGIKKIKGNKRKSRYTFILAQLYQETGKKEQALAAYHQVIRRNPEYPLLFNAQIRSAEVFSGEGNVSTLRKELNKMRKKKWNEPYLDQIYYALGNISFNEGKIDDAIGLYKKSVSVSQNNIHQKALSSLTLGDIYFDKRNYIPSGCYYDSAMAIIDDKYPNYENIHEKYTSLNRLVTNLKIIETEDSLQRLAGLPKTQLDKLVASWVEAEKKKQEEIMQGGDEGGDMMSAYYRANSSRMRLGGDGGSSFYFYNTSTVSYGKKEFTKLWGERKNEDDWRRKNKTSLNIDDNGEPIEGELAEQIIEDKSRADDPTTAEFYTQDIPFTDSMMQASNLKIRDALFNSGSIFKNDFNDFTRSIGSFSNLNERYPENIYLLTSWFNLWDLYKIIEKPDSSDYYKALIVGKYPATNYAKYLVNPNFFIEEAARKDSINKLYNLAFAAFKNNDLNNAAMASNKVISMQPDTSINSKAQFIRIIAESKNKDKAILGDSLKAYIVQYPTAQPVKLAEKILSYIRDDRFSNYEQMVASGYLNDVIKNNELLSQNTQTGSVDASKWNTDNELLHYFIIAFPNQNQIDVNRLKFDLANYNLDHYTSLDFEIETEMLNQETNLVIVRNFENKESAMVYFMSIIRKPDVFKTLAGKPYLNFIASNNNYRQMLNDRSYDEYIAYFVKNYSNLTSGKFSDQELESPEELMARLRKDPNSELKEEGEFVIVETAETATQNTLKKEQLFTANYNVPHNVAIMIQQKNFSTGYLMRDLMKFNVLSQRDKNLKINPGKLTDFTLLLISKFTNAYEANEYIKLLNNKKELFSTVGSSKFEIFSCSDENLAKLTETNNVEEWNKFYQINYARRSLQAPKPIETKAAESKKQEEKTVVEESTPVTTTVNVQENNNVTNNPPVIAVNNQETTTATKDSVQITPDRSKENITETTNTKPTTLTDNNIPSANQPEIIDTVQKDQIMDVVYTSNPESLHNLIYLLPVKSPNITLLTTYLGRLNAAKFSSSGITITTEPLNDIMSMVIVKGLANKSKAAAYLIETKNDPRVAMSLKNVTFKSYLISNDNLLKLKTSKNLAAYQQFFEQNY